MDARASRKLAETLFKIMSLAHNTKANSLGSQKCIEELDLALREAFPDKRPPIIKRQISAMPVARHGLKEIVAAGPKGNLDRQGARKFDPYEMRKEKKRRMSPGEK